jgi:hypothetical protein
MQILIKKIKEINWNIDIPHEILEKWFELHKKSFKYYGRSIEILLTKTKIIHSKRIFCNINNIKKNINLDDLNNGFELMNFEKTINNNYLYSLYH